MSLEEKVSLWVSLQSRESAPIDGDEMFQGVGDDEDDAEIATQRELTDYVNVIHRSAAYDWFLASIRKQSVLQPTPSQATTSPTCLAFDGIREAILRQLRVRKFSRRGPLTRRFTFQVPTTLPLDIAQQRQLLERIPDSLVSTVCGGQAQVTTVREYIGQTWPIGGAEFFGIILEGVFKGMSEPEKLPGQLLTSHIDILPDMTRVEVRIEIGKLYVTVEGVPYSIAECGEQLAWVAALLFGDRPEGTSIIEVKPRITLLGAGLGMAIDVSEATDGMVWAQILRPLGCQAIVHGYPVRRRPDCPLVVSSETFPLSAESRSLLLINQVDGGFRFNWHPTTFTAESSRRAAASATESGWPKFPAIHEEGNSTVPQHTFCNCGLAVQRDKVERLDSEHDGPCSTRSQSLDLDMLSVPSGTDDGWDQDCGNLGRQAFARVFRHNLQRVLAGGQHGTSSGSGSTSGPPNQTTPRAPAGPSRPLKSKKHGRQNGDNGDEEDDAPNHPKRPKLKDEAPAGSGKRLLACPFWKHDQLSHWNCSFQKNDTIGHLKQHLKRRHTPDFYCAVCFATFKDDLSHHAHVQSATCVLAPGVELVGITHKQRTQLGKNSQRGSSDEAKWHHIWKILFPRATPPESIYLESGLSEVLCLIREFSQGDEALSILREEILDMHGEALGSNVPPSQSDETLRRTVERIFERLCIRLLASQQSPNNQNSDSTTTSDSASRPLRPRAIQSPLTSSGHDSGVALGPGPGPSVSNPFISQGTRSQPSDATMGFILPPSLPVFPVEYGDQDAPLDNSLWPGPGPSASNHFISQGTRSQPSDATTGFTSPPNLPAFPVEYGNQGAPQDIALWPGQTWQAMGLESQEATAAQRQPPSGSFDFELSDTALSTARAQTASQATEEQSWHQPSTEGTHQDQMDEPFFADWVPGIDAEDRWWSNN